MKIAIMQPYFVPYIGYFQLLAAVDRFVLYDNIQYTKKGWINRNRILLSGNDTPIRLPLKKASDYLDVKDRHLAQTWPKERIKTLNKVKCCYEKAPCFQDTFPIIEKIMLAKHNNLFDFLHNSIVILAKYMNIDTDIVISSKLNIDSSLKAEQKVIEICKIMKATDYINPIGGSELYSKTNFANNQINLHFLKSNDIDYSQFGNDFVPWLSIIDILMFNSCNKVQRYLRDDFLLK